MANVIVGVNEFCAIQVICCFKNGFCKHRLLKYLDMIIKTPPNFGGVFRASICTHIVKLTCDYLSFMIAKTATPNIISAVKPIGNKKLYISFVLR